MRKKFSRTCRRCIIVGLCGVLVATHQLAAQFELESQGFDGTPGTIFAVPEGTVPYWSVDGACSGAVIYQDGSRGDGGSACLRNPTATRVGTRMIRDLNPGPGDSALHPTAATLGYDSMFRLVLSADDGGDTGHELYVLNSPLYPVMTLHPEVPDINPGPASSTPMGFSARYGDPARVYFSADDGTNGRELWGAWENLRHRPLADMLMDINPGPGSSNPNGFSKAPNDVVVFAADDGTNGRELWKTVPWQEAGNTALLVNINATTPGASSDPQQLTISAHGHIYFTADDGVHGRELWKTNGTTEGTGLVMDIVDGPAGSNPTNLTNTRFFLEENHVTSLAFTVDSDGVDGKELWISHGAGFLEASNTSMLFDPGTAGDPENLISLTALNLLFFTVGNDLYQTDGTPEGTVLVQSFVAPPANLIAAGATANVLYFAADDGTGNGVELWRADAAGATLVKDIQPGPGSSSPENLFAIRNTVFFSADDGTHGRELWRTDPVEGAVLVMDINPGAAGSAPADMIDYEGTLLFTADDGTHGREIWQSDGYAELAPAGWSYKWDLASLIQERSGNPEMLAVAGTDEDVFSVYWLYDFPAMGQPVDMVSHSGHQANVYVEVTNGSDRAPLNISDVDCGDGNLPRPKADLTDGEIHAAIAFGMVAVVDQDPCDQDWITRFRAGVPFSHAPAVFDGQEWVILSLDNFEAGVPTDPPSGGRVMAQTTQGGYLIGGGLPSGLQPAWQPPWATRRYAWARMDVFTDYIRVLFGNHQGSLVWVATLPRQYKGSFEALYAGNSACLQSPHVFFFDSVILNGGLFTGSSEPFGACCTRSGCIEVPSEAECDGTFTPWVACDDPGYLCCPTPWADGDWDGDVDSVDFGILQQCYTAGSPGAQVAQECLCLDHNNDGVIDQADVEAFIQCATGPGIIMDIVPPECGGP